MDAARHARWFVGTVMRSHHDGTSTVLRIRLDDGTEWSLRAAPEAVGLLHALGGSRRYRFSLAAEANLIVGVESDALPG